MGQTRYPYPSLGMWLSHWLQEEHLHLRSNLQRQGLRGFEWQAVRAHHLDRKFGNQGRVVHPQEEEEERPDARGEDRKRSDTIEELIWSVGCVN